jgi:hypothetical protein
MKEKTLKGLVHAGLALAVILEAKDAKAPRRFLLGLAAGWHLYATFYHWMQEDERRDW